MPDVYIESNGCAVLRHETSRLGLYFSRNGWREVDSVLSADVVVYTGCGVIDLAQDAALEAIGRLVAHARPEAELVVAGCLPSIDREAIEAVSPRLRLIEQREMGAFDDLIDALVPFSDVAFNAAPARVHTLGLPRYEVAPERPADDTLLAGFDPALHAQMREVLDYATKGRYLLTESGLFEIRATWGCARNCSFCAIKHSIGDIRSKPLEAILAEVDRGVNEGYDRFLLVGDELGYYGRDLGLTLSDLVDAVHERTIARGHRARLGIRYIYPDALVDGYEALRPHFESGFVYYFCSAFQSGSPEVLWRMGRRREIEPFLRVLEDMHQREYETYRHTQVIVGFPGESDEDFLSTIDALDRARFDFVTVVGFSARRRTRAEKMPGRLDAHEMSRRVEAMEAWAERNRALRIEERFARILRRVEGP